jgi:hypothetical protein
MFNEYVYLSDAKLRQFGPSDASWWSRMRIKKITGKARIGPVETTVEIEASDVARSEADVQKLIEHLSADARWYREDGLIPGTWVYFEGRIGSRSLPDGGVLFCEAGKPDKTATRILLHGSAKHLAGVTPAAVPREPGMHSHIEAASSVVESALANVSLTGSERAFWGAFGRRESRVPGPVDLAAHVSKVFREVACTDEYFESAPYVGGCARVSAVLRPPGLAFGVVVASPLFVRSTRP